MHSLETMKKLNDAATQRAKSAAPVLPVMPVLPVLPVLPRQ